VVDPKIIIGKKWRAEEEERHKGSLTQKKKTKKKNIIYGHLVILSSFGIFSFILVYCTENNLATLV
jgi:hypothetical protein